MKVVIHRKQGIPWQRRYARMFEEGFAKYGIEVQQTARAERLDCDFAILSGPNYWRDVASSGVKHFFINRAFFGDKDRWVALSWDGYNGLGRFCVKDIDSKRWDRHRLTVKPWQAGQPNGNVLVCGQYDGPNNALDGEYKHWLAQSMKLPLASFRKWPAGTRSLADDCLYANYAVTFNSTVAPQVLMEGVPVCAMDRSNPIYGAVMKDYDPTQLYPNRRFIFEYLSNCMWHDDEILAGDFWPQLEGSEGKRLYECFAESSTF